MLARNLDLRLEVPDLLLRLVPLGDDRHPVVCKKLDRRLMLADDFRHLPDRLMSIVGDLSQLARKSDRRE